MHDIRAIRQNSDVYDQNWSRRGLTGQTESILKMDSDWRNTETQLQDILNKRNTLSKQIGDIKKAGGDVQSIMDEVATLKDQMVLLEDQSRQKREALDALLSSLPNLLADTVPDGSDETQNIVLRTWAPNANPLKTLEQDHVDIGVALGMIDFETAVKMSGSRFVVLSGAIARLERALGQFMLDHQINEYGYTEISPPLMVRDQALFGTGQLPKFGEDLFRMPDTGHWLIPTAEVVLTNLVADQILDAADLPLRFTAQTPCFRSEAGSAGRDTRGMIRLHQFLKVEMVSITTPEQAEAEHERMTESAESLLKKLKLPFRTVALCSGDTGFGSMLTYDLEVWVPAQKTYREISSCSTFGDFQARRMNTRFRHKGDKETNFVYTLNGSGLPVGRTLVAVIENYYDPATKSIIIPDILKPYMGGLTQIQAVA